MPIGSKDEFNIGTDAHEQASVPGASERNSAPLPSEVATGQANPQGPIQEKHRRKRKTKPDASGAPTPQDAKQKDQQPSGPVATYSVLYNEDRKTLHRKIAIVGGVLVLLCIFSCCLDDYKGRIAPPTEVLWCYGLFFQQLFASITGGDVLQPMDIMAMDESYFNILNRAGVTAITVVAGMILALAGTLYQTVFRNPIASPTMLGVNSGIQLGQVILVLVFGTLAVDMTGFNYLFSYICVAVTIALLMLFTKLMSGKGQGLQVVNMLIVGTILSQLIGVAVNYITWNIFDDDMWETYNSISEALTVNTELVSYLTIFIGCAVAIIPIFILRFRINVLSFGPTEMKMLGVDPNKLQMVALLCGTILMLTAQIHTGTVAMLSLVVPHVSRYLFGAEFRKQFWGNLLLGAAILVFCRCVIMFIPFVGGGLPIGTVVSFVVMPVFVWMIATQQRSWE